MAQWRAIHRKITTSWDVAQLNRLGKILFTWGIVCADNYGILEDDLGAIKLEILAGEDCTLDEIEKELCVMEERGLIWRYDGGKPLLQFQCFDDYQPKELLRKRGKSKWPVHPDWQPPEDVEVRHMPEKADIGPTRPEKAPRKKDIDRQDRNREKAKKKPRKRGSSESRKKLKHWAFQIWRDVFGKKVKGKPPDIDQRDAIIAFAESKGEEWWRKRLEYWKQHPWSPWNFKGMMETKWEPKDGAYKQDQSGDTDDLPYDDFAAAQREAARLDAAEVGDGGSGGE